MSRNHHFLSNNKGLKYTGQIVRSLSLSSLLTMSSILPSLAQLPATRTPAPNPRRFAPLPVTPPPRSQQIPSNDLGTQSPEQGYTLGAGDRISLDIIGVPEFSKEYQILVDGSLNLPLIRSVYVQGLTQQQAADAIAKLYDPYITAPIVTLTLILPRPLTIGIAGEVSRPGSYKISASREGEAVKFPTLIEMLQLAKGVTPGGDLRLIQVRRRQRSGPEQVINVNLQEFLQTGDLRQDITLRDGDTIFVPSATEVNSQEVRQRANANFSADITQPISVVIVGEVNRPGPYTVFASDLRSSNQQTELGFVAIDQQQGTLVGLPTVTRAIKIAGGITLEADLRRVQVRRRLKTGNEQIISVNLWDLLQTGDISQDVLLQEGDSIIVPTAENVDIAEISQIAATSFSPNSIRINVVGEVLRPGTVEVTPNTSLHQALLATGSFNQVRAQKKTVELLRLNPNGTVTRRSIDVDFSQGLNAENNPSLRNNDVIIVPRSGLTRLADNVNQILQPVSGVVGVISGVTGWFTGVETTINTFQRLFLGGDFDRRNQLRQIRQQEEDRRRTEEERQRQNDIQNQQLELQRQIQQQQLDLQRQQLEQQQQQQQQQNQ